MKRILLLVLAAVGTLNPTFAETKIVRVAYIPIAECIELYVAERMGFFEHEGIKVELTQMAGGAKILNAIVSGDIDIGFTNVVSLAVYSAQGS